MWSTDYSCLHETYESPGLKPLCRHVEGSQARLCMKTIHVSVDLLEMENNEMGEATMTPRYHVVHYV